MTTNITPLYPDLKIDSWLKDGTHHTPTLPLLAKYITSRCPQSVLDVGCGSGELLRLLQAEGLPKCSLFGLDLEPDHVTLARRRTGLTTIGVGQLPSDPSWPKSFSIIATINILHNDWSATYAHGCRKLPPDPDRLRKFSDEAAKLLAPNGLLLWDWHGPDNGLDCLHRFAGWGWQCRDCLHFPPHTGGMSLPEHYTIYICNRP